VAGAVLFAAPWCFLPILMKGLPWWAQGLILGVALKPAFAFRRLLEAGCAVRAALERGDLPEARRLVSWHLVSRDTVSLSEGQVASATVESLAENLTDSFFAPLLCFTVGGLPFAWLYRFVNTADAMIGYHTERYEFLGKAAARLDDALNWLPARLAAATLVAAAAVCGMDAVGAWRTMAMRHRDTASPNAGWTMAAAAGAMRVRLRKVGCYDLGGGPEYPTVRDVHRAGVLVAGAALICALACGGLIIGIAFAF
jgi:adenosylcobinamide-phosphate synthase